MNLFKIFKRDSVSNEALDEANYTGLIKRVINCQQTDEKIAKKEGGPKYSINQRIKSMFQHYQRIHGKEPGYTARLKLKEAAYNEEIWLQNIQNSR